MPDVLSEEITGTPVEVTIAGKLCRLIYPMHALILYKQRTGDSLFQQESWNRIDLAQDPERWTALLWAGMHEEQPDGTWKSPFSYSELEKVLNFSNAIALRPSVLKAVAAWLPRSEKGEEDKSPNAPAAPGTPSPVAEIPTSSPGSGPGASDGSASSATSS
jgi:hypothetical protein